MNNLEEMCYLLKNEDNMSNDYYHIEIISDYVKIELGWMRDTQEEVKKELPKLIKHIQKTLKEFDIEITYKIFGRRYLEHFGNRVFYSALVYIKER